MFVRTLSNSWLNPPFSALAFTPAFSPLRGLQSELERFVAFSQRDLPSDGLYAQRPAEDVELKDVGPQLVFSTRLPGVTPEQLELTLTSSTLQLRAERKVAVPEGYRARRLERKNYTMERSYRLPVKIEPESAQAKLVDGILSITLTKATEAAPRAIAVHAA